jgi:tetratricopeptide (TPR) repeat protein
MRIARLLKSTSLSLVIYVLGFCGVNAQHDHPYQVPEEGLGHAHIEIPCSPEASKTFDKGLVLLHNFWYSRALETFKQATVIDPECGMAYWGEAMTFNHPFWDAPSAIDNKNAWDIIQKAAAAKKISDRDKLFISAATDLYKDSENSRKSDRDDKYREGMAAAHKQYSDDETKLFYGLAIMGTIKEGSKGFDRQEEAARLFEEVFEKNPNHPGVLHYLVHVYDDPVHAKQGLDAAQRYAAAAAAVPHALHMPSHIFTRLGLWSASEATNERAWKTSELDVKRAGEPNTFRDFHSLNYLQYAYIQLGKFNKARWAFDTIKSEYDALKDKTTAKDTPELQARHVRGRTIYALPDRVIYGYFDMLTRYLFETKDWQAAQNIPLLVESRDFLAVKLQMEAISAAMNKDQKTSTQKSSELAALTTEPGQHPFVQQIITIQAREAEAFSAYASGNMDQAVKKMTEAIEIENSIDSLSQPPYPIIPANELFGSLLMEMRQPEVARKHFLETLKRTPARPMAIYGAAQASREIGDNDLAKKLYGEFLDLWKDADADRPELKVAKSYLQR